MEEFLLPSISAHWGVLHAYETYPDSSDSRQASRAPKMILLTNPGPPSPHHCTDHGLATAFRRHTPHDTSPASVACPSVNSLAYIQYFTHSLPRCVMEGSESSWLRLVERLTRSRVTRPSPAPP